MSVKIYRSKTFVTEPVRAVFPHLNKLDRYGSYSLAIDVYDNPDLKSQFEEQAYKALDEAHQATGTTDKPSNQWIRLGDYKGQPYARIQFKMNGTRKVKGRDVAVSPTIVDAKKNPMTEEVFGGSRVRISYYWQYTQMPGGTTYLTLKLKGVQVLELVGPEGEVEVDAASDFDVEEGFESSGERPEPVPEDNAAGFNY